MNKSVFQAIYDSEINFSIACFWDGGFRVRLGDPQNGFKADEHVADWNDVHTTLIEMVLTHYPDSAFAQSVKVEKDKIMIVCQPAILDRVRALLDRHKASKDT